jgi:NTP pyrophosphatase (non-canonical NTP hydrolase)
MIDLKQKEFAEWQKKNFGGGELSDMIHGMSEEVGEMAHAYLKGKQRIRNYTPEKARDEMADSFADCMVFGIQAMIALGLDAEAVLNMVFRDVLSRNFKENQNGK